MTTVICGIQRRDGRPAERAVVEEMLRTMNPLAKPAVADIVTDGPVGLGVMALATSDAAPPARPRVLPMRDGWLAADVRLYGAGAIGAEALAEALEVDGNPARLHGDFAYSRWDRASSAIELARDHFGVRPLQYVHRRGAYLAFASLPQALLRTGLAERVLDSEALRHFHFSAFAPQERTYFAQIRCVQAAHVHRFEVGCLSVAQRYWRLAIPPRLPFESDPAGLATELRRLLDQAVRRRLPAAGPGAGDISGGLDSTPIAVLAARALAEEGRRFTGFSLQEARGGPVPIVDEGPDVAAAAESEANLDVVPVPTRGFYEILRDGHDPDTFHSAGADEPVNFALGHAAATGAPVYLSGWGGDEIVTHAGRGAYAELFWAGHWGLLRRALGERTARLGGTVRGRLTWQVLLQSLPVSLRLWLLRLTGRADPFGKARAEPAPFLPRHRRGGIARSPLVDGPDTRRNRRGYAEDWWMQKRLEAHAQQAAPHGLAYAFPMLDLDLIDFAMRVPGIFNAAGAGDRNLIRAAVEGILPDRVRLRVEKLMAYPLESLRLAEGRKEMIERLGTMGRSALVRDFVDVAALSARMAALPSADEARSATIAAAEQGEQPVLDDGGYETALRLAAILAEHEGILCAPVNGDEGEA